MSEETTRPYEYTDKDLENWLDDMKPFLKRGNSIHYACNKAGLSSQYWTILERYKANKTFSQKIDAYRAYAGELTNDVIVSEVERIKVKQADGGTLTKEEISILKLMAEKHRTAQPFFVSRVENAEADPNTVGKILDTIEADNEGISDYDDVGQKAKEQVVATEQPLQDQG